MTPTRRYAISLFLVLGLTAVVTLALPHTASAASAFDLKNGIVGNLSYQCREAGNCTWCDFIGLMLVLQKTILSLFGGLALIMLVWGGQGIITAAGNQEHIKKSKDLITATLLGVAIILAAYFLVNIIVGILITPKGSTGLKTDLFGSNWWEAQCTITDKNAPEFCRGKSEGTLCGNDDKVCVNDQCILSCAGVESNYAGFVGTCSATAPCAPPTEAQNQYCPNNGVCCVGPR